MHLRIICSQLRIKWQQLRNKAPLLRINLHKVRIFRLQLRINLPQVRIICSELRIIKIWRIVMHNPSKKEDLYMDTSSFPFSGQATKTSQNISSSSFVINFTQISCLTKLIIIALKHISTWCSHSPFNEIKRKLSLLKKSSRLLNNLKFIHTKIFS